MKKFDKSSIRVFQRRLANLSPRNRSLLLLNLPQEQFLDVHDLDFLAGTSSFDVITACIAGKSNVLLCDVLDARYEKVNEVSKRLRRMARTAAFIEAERGTEDLYLGWPLVQGKFSDGTVIRAPLLFWPVNVRVSPQNRWVLDRRDEPLSLNRSLVMAYAHFNGLRLSEELYEKDFEDFPKDALAFRTALYEWLKETPLTLNYNSDLFENQLQFFPKLFKSDLERTERNGELRLVPHAVLGIFPQAGSYLVRDYEALLADETVAYSPVQSIPTQYQKLREADMLTPFLLDASQEAAFRRIKKGESLVIQGPPGTGKSQLICNLIADFTAQGKRVLVVSQKRAALDTVYERLSLAGWQPFVANLHDFQHDRKSLYDQIAGQIDRIDEYRRLNTSLDAILLEREFTQNAHQIDRIQQELQDFKTALFDARVCGLSPKELYLTSHPQEEHFDLGEWYQSFHFDTYAETLRRFKRYELYATRLGTDHPWADRVNFSGLSFQAVPQIRALIQQVPTQIQELNRQWEQLMGRKLSWTEMRTLPVEGLQTFQRQLTPELEPWLQKVHRQQIPDWESWPERRALERIEQVGLLQDTLKSSELTDFRTRLETALQARNSLVKWLFFKEKESIRAEAEQQGLSLELADLQQLKARLDRRIEAEQHMRRWAEQAEVTVLAEDWSVSRERWENVGKQLKQASELYQQIQRGPSLLKELHFEGLRPFRNQLETALQLAAQFQTAYQSWRVYLTDGQIEQLIQQPDTTVPALTTTLTDDFEWLHEWDTLKNQLSTAEREMLQRYEGQTLVAAFDNSLRLAWLDHLEVQHPILRSVSGLGMSQREEELRAAVVRKQELAGEIGRMRLREQTYESLETNRLGNTITYRDLRHQVTKKRLIWPVRQVLATFAEEIFSLVPCWLASPETVSAVFSFQCGTKPLFDLVIFDEASQCFAEQGLPAMFRGEQVVIAGDSQQLQPSDLYRVRFEEETEDVPELEVISLLELMARDLPQVVLQGHYRSRSLDLIDFSNQHFYQNRLKLLPDFQEMNRREGAIRYLKVEGEWKNQSNVVEAEAIRSLVEDLVRQEPERSIGIVTFNAPQQRLLEDTLEGLSPKPDLLFIKNLENVQGDERDIIIFSIGYAPNERGKVALQFGSLNQAGGENRLNVAITRARERIYVVTSLWPEQLHVEETVNAGPKLLKQYLNFARQVSQGAYKPKPLMTAELESNQLLKDQLQRQQPQWKNELPFADLVEKEQECYKRLILTDDDVYYQSLSAKEAHAYFPLSLERKGWLYQRIWSREWWKRQG